ncbi:glucose-6-phosphate dehydrogenase, partial [Candidatus Sumerlaeota bacterium]|nr:glucose-6-phosphate dehydrogenase [Candidatus Sumerlaeota bacterium]
ESYTMLRERLVSIERSGDTAGNRFFYLATPAESFPAIVRRLRDANLIYDNRSKIHSAWSRVVIEKPFGRNLASARELNNLVSCVLDESQTYRIDHFLGKETVQNILVLRFGNSIFEPVWNRKNISFVEITVAETLGIENRGQYYDRAGVLRDMVQNHLMQLLALCAMEQPARFGAEEIRDEKAKVLHSMRPFEATSIHHNLVLGQYQGYQQERNIAVNSLTPTFAAMRVEIANWRWQGIPFYLRTGKCLRNKVSEIVLHFLPVPLCLFGLKDVCHHVKPNVLVLRIQPNEGISLRMSCKVPGENLAVGTVSMNFSYQEAFRKPGGDAYERLLLDVMRGNATLFSRRDEVELAWEYLDPILESCENGGGPALHSYPKGSDGPAAANELVTRSGHSWKEFA